MRPPRRSRSKIVCQRCKALNNVRIKMGGLVCNKCNIIVAYPGSKEYSSKLREQMERADET